MPRQRDLFDTASFSVPKMGIWLYRKDSISNAEVRRILQQIPLSYGPDCMVYTDAVDSFGAWLRLKDSIEAFEGGLLIISSLKDIGRSVGDVADEVSWIMEKGLEVVVMDCPSTFVFEKPQDNGMVFGIVSEVWDNVMRTVAPVVKRPFYPEGWDAMYREWKAGKVKTKEFIAWSGMSAGTLNTRLQAYGPIADGTVEIMPLRRKSERYEYL